jgi:hypothetical protein
MIEENNNIALLNHMLNMRLIQLGNQSYAETPPPVPGYRTLVGLAESTRLAPPANCLI